MKEKFALIAFAVLVTLGFIILSASITSCGKTETVFVNQVQERPTVRVALYNAATPRSMLRVTCGRGGALLSYLTPDEGDTIQSFVGDTLFAIFNTGRSRDSLVTPMADTSWRF